MDELLWMCGDSVTVETLTSGPSSTTLVDSSLPEHLRDPELTPSPPTDTCPPGSPSPSGRTPEREVGYHSHRPTPTGCRDYPEER